MDTEQPTYITACPDPEELSFYYDQPSDHAIAEHVTNCEHCQQTLAAFYQIERLTSALSAPPAGLAQRINAAVRQAHPAGKIPAAPHLAWPILSQAASWLLVAVLGGWLLYSYARRDPTNVRLAASNQPVHKPAALSDTTQLRKIETPLPNEGFSLHDQLNLNGNVEITDLRNVSTGMSVKESYPKSRQQALASRVRHIWLTDTLASGRIALEEAARLHDCTVDWQDNGPKHTLVAILSATDKNIQKLVNRLYAHNLQLLSPTFPQPLAERKASFTGNKMLYQVVLVQKE
ncbi:MAG: hypothetical protein GX564_07945 [Oligosphaeraceae bacterium]|nr:hypothetical protein [Oligosphaeraceae bacterium]